MLDYEEFMDIIPEETKEYVKTFLSLYYKDLHPCSDKQLRIIDASFIALCSYSDIVSEFDDMNEYKEKINYNLSVTSLVNEVDIESAYVTLSKYLNIYSDKYLLEYLTPEEIYLYILNHVDQKKIEHINIGEKVEHNLKIKINNQYQKMFEEDLSGYSYDIIEFLKLVSNNREKLLSNDKIVEEYGNDEKIYISLSVLFAILESDFTELKPVKDLFKEYNITKDIIPNINLKIKRSGYESIKELYLPIISGKNNSNLYDVISSFFNYSYIGSCAIISKYTKKYIELHSKISDLSTYISLHTKMNNINASKEFYEEIQKNTRDFLILANKYYQILKNKLLRCECNTRVISTFDDIDTLSIYIASHFYDTSIEKFFNDYGIEFDKVMEYLDLDIKKEEIDNTSVDDNIMIKVFKPYITNGRNERKSLSEITINDVSSNLCNNEYNKSRIIETIFEEFNRNYSLPTDFFDFMEKHFKEKEKNRKEKLYKDYFDEKTFDEIEFIKKYYNNYSMSIHNEKNKVYTKEEIKYFSLLHTLLEADEQFNEEFAILRINENDILSYDDKDYNFDIDVVINELTDFLNKVTNNEPITVQNVIKNIYSNKNIITNRISAVLEKYTNCSINELENLVNRKEIIKQRLQEKEQEEILKYKLRYRNYLENGTIIDKAYHYSEYFKIYLPNNDDHERYSLALLLSLIDVCDNSSKNYNSSTYSRKRKYFEKNRLTFNNVIHEFYFKNPKDYLAKTYTKENAVNRFFENYPNEADDYINEADIFKRFFNEPTDFILDLFNKLSINFEVVKREVIKERDYCSTISVEENIDYLNSLAVPCVSTNYINLSDIITYGSELNNYPECIYDECKKVINDYESLDLSKVDEEISKVIASRKPKLFTKFKKKEQSVEYTLDDIFDQVSNGKKLIGEDIKSFYHTAEYLEVLINKYKEYEKQLDDAIKRVEEQNVENFLDYSKQSILLNALKDRKNTFYTARIIIEGHITQIYAYIQSNLLTINKFDLLSNVIIPLLKDEALMNKQLRFNRDKIKLYNCLLDAVRVSTETNNDSINKLLKEISNIDVVDKKQIEAISSYIKNVEDVKAEIVDKINEPIRLITK